jgi:hypothetical protein
MKIEDGRITPLRSVLVLRGLGAGTWPSEALRGIAETFNVLVIDAPDGVTVETFDEREMLQAGWVRTTDGARDLVGVLAQRRDSLPDWARELLAPYVRPFIRDTTSCDECGLVGEHEADCETGAVAEHTEALS